MMAAEASHSAKFKRLIHPTQALEPPNLKALFCLLVKRYSDLEEMISFPTLKRPLTFRQLS
ncbi:hypothetical protein ACSVDA_17570 [Cytobacillus sp. Hm23]